MTQTLDTRAIEDLVTRVDAQLPAGSGRLLAFIASGPGEGTSTIAQNYVGTAALQFRRRVLLLRAAGGPGLLKALADGEPVEALVKPLAAGGVWASLGDAQARDLWDLLARNDLWQPLRGLYDEIVLDLPSAAVSRLGLVAAAQCDGVVVVLEAEKTRAPVVENLIASLRAVRAKVLGTVMNRRRFYVPPRIYRWL